MGSEKQLGSACTLKEELSSQGKPQDTQGSPWRKTFLDSAEPYSPSTRTYFKKTQSYDKIQNV